MCVSPFLPALEAPIIIILAGCLYILFQLNRVINIEELERYNLYENHRSTKQITHKLHTQVYTTHSRTISCSHLRLYNIISVNKSIDKQFLTNRNSLFTIRYNCKRKKKKKKLVPCDMLGRIFYLEVAMKRRNRKREKVRTVDRSVFPSRLLLFLEETKRNETKTARPIKSPKNFQKFVEKNHFRPSSKMIDDRKRVHLLRLNSDGKKRDFWPDEMRCTSSRML